MGVVYDARMRSRSDSSAGATHARTDAPQARQIQPVNLARKILVYLSQQTAHNRQRTHVLSLRYLLMRRECGAMAACERGVNAV